MTWLNELLDKDIETEDEFVRGALTVAQMVSSQIEELRRDSRIPDKEGVLTFIGDLAKIVSEYPDALKPDSDTLIHLMCERPAGHIVSSRIIRKRMRGKSKYYIVLR